MSINGCAGLFISRSEKPENKGSPGACAGGLLEIACTDCDPGQTLSPCRGRSELG